MSERRKRSLSLFTAPLRIYRFWQHHCFYAQVDVKKQLNASLTFAAAQPFTTDDDYKYF